MRQLFSSPKLSDEENSERASTLSLLVLTLLCVVSVANFAISIAQPALTPRVVVTLVEVWCLALAVLALNRRGWATIASWLFVAGAVLIVTRNSISGGGIRSPGVTMFYVFALAAGLLLGLRAGITVALACATIGLALVLSERYGVLPPQTFQYSAFAYWCLNVFYMGLVIFLLHLATRSIRRAFHRAETELAARSKAERHLNVALDAGAIGIWEWTPATGDLIWDDRMCALYELPPHSTVSLELWASFIAEEDRASHCASLRPAVDPGHPKYREFRITTRTGRWRHIYSAEKSFPGQDGRSPTIIGINMDITARKLAEAEAGEVKRRLQTLVDEATVGVVVHQDFKPVAANRALARMFGYDSENDILDVSDVRELVADRQWDQLTDYYNARARGLNCPEYVSVRCKTRTGAPIDIENRAFPITWDGQPSMCTMVTDVTQQRMLEAQLGQSQRLEAVGQMTGGISHDFNNLLTVILGNARLLEGRLSSDESLGDIAALIRMAAERGAKLTSRLLAFSRQQALDIRPANVNELIAGVEGLILGALGEHISLEIACAPELWQASVDALQLENALLNLAVNARDAMPNGGHLSIRTKNVVIEQAPEADPEHPDVIRGEYVLISVFDTGVGMDERTLQRAFEPYFTTKDFGKGSGLGLSMVYGFVRQLSGHVRLKSKPGLGTTVELYLPRLQSLPASRQPVMTTSDDAARNAGIRPQAQTPPHRKKVPVI
jgi:PAS domain S-box-containing protein